MMENDNDDAHRAACLGTAGRPDVDAIPLEAGTASQSGSQGGPGGSGAERRVISRSAASVIVALPGFVLLGLGLFLFKTVPYPGDVLGEEPFALYFCGLTATTTGTAALASAVFLAASNVVSAGARQSRAAIYVLGLALIAALAALA